jgi:branched-chain amino acid transport system permease protein
MDYYIHLLILICIYLILAQSFNLTFGMGRLFNLAHVAVYAIGAYTTALWSTEGGASFFQCVALSMLLSGLFALLIGAISLRLEQDYFAIGSLAFSSVISALLINWKSVTRGVLGIPGIPRPELWGIDFSVNLNFLYLILTFVVLTQAILYVFFRNSFSRALRGQAEGEFACMAIGKDTRATRNFSFFISSAFAGLAGCFFSYYINYIDPSSFSLTEMVFILTIIVVGKPGSFWGVIGATIFLVLLPEPLRFVEMPPSILGPLRQLIYALIQFGVVYVKRETLFPVERRI